MTSDTRALLARRIRDRASALGFDRAGFCDAAPPPERVHYERWLDGGLHGEMAWLERGRERRLDPSLVLEGVRSMVVTATSYQRPGAPAGPPPDAPQPAGAIARYAAGRDYHETIGARLGELALFIEQAAPGHRARPYVDTGPVLERMWAARAGVGWIGKNALVLNREMGSWFFLGVILTTLELPADEPAADQCGACSLCVEACPTGAIVEPRVVDSRRCISYHTIELRGPIPAQHRAAVGQRVFGCDDCQDACPWNRDETAPAAAPADPSAPLLALLTMPHREYLTTFRGSAIKRATWPGLRRNAAVALGNAAAAIARDDPAGAAAIAGRLEEVARDDPDPVVADHASWGARRARGG